MGKISIRIIFTLIGIALGGIIGIIFGGIVLFWFTGVSENIREFINEIFNAGQIAAMIFIFGFMIYGGREGFKLAKKINKRIGK